MRPEGANDLAACVADWDPPAEQRADPLDPAPAATLAGVLDAGPDPVVPTSGDPLPPLWHWVYFLRRPSGAELGADGHPRSGSFLPPLPERRRVFGGGRCSFERPLRLGTQAIANSALAKHEVKHGRSGPLLLVTVRTEYSQDGRLCVVDEQDLVYRSCGGHVTPPPPLDPVDVPAGAVVFDPVTMFRFSAVTANAHRIHYDLPYARDVEGHPGLLVHGPLLALTLTERARAARGPVRAAEYRLHRPLYAGQPVTVSLDAHGDTTTVKALGVDGAVRASAVIHHH